MYYYKNSTDTVPILLLLLFSLTITLHFQAKTVALPSSSCPKHCGDVEILYPFGIGPGCAMEGFELSCNKTKDGRSVLMFFGEIPVLNILLLNGQVRIMKHISTMYSLSSRQVDYDYWGQDLFGTPFTYSGKSNMFTVVGINTLAYITDDTYVLGCVSHSPTYNNVTAQDGLCTGVGCCRVALTRDMSNDYVFFDSRYNTTNNYTNGSNKKHTDYQGYAVIMETTAFHFKTTYLNTTTFLDENDDGRVPVILNWAVGNETCNDSMKKADSYACLSNNSMCIDSSNGHGYLCNCTKGYHGNPYLRDGCQDIDECVVNVPPPCPGHCVNTIGSFWCPNEKPASSSHSGSTVLVVGPSIGVVILVIAITCTYLIRERKKLANIKQKYFQQHGGMLLLQEIRSKQGTDFSIFTEAELIEATGKFDNKNILGRGGHRTVYKGTLKDGSLIAVKRCISMTSEQQKEFGKEMLILSQINHKNIVKLLGCCLEVEVPMLVYEFIPNGTLFHFIHGDNGCHNITLSTRLHIALESAHALAYLHSWASPPILHGDVKSSNILLDENYAAKVSDFGASILAPTDESQFVTLVQGTCGYLDPEYMQMCQLTDKSDVYSFGIVLLELLTGKKAFNLEGPDNEKSLSQRFLCALKEGRLMDIIDNCIKIDSDTGLLEEIAELARQCLEMVGEMRPAMRDVAEKLDRLSKVMQHPWEPAQHNLEEMESLLGESSVASLDMISTGNFSMKKRIVQGLLESGR
ncbi:unnamed protein product [Urochloa decumbens]|uniref:Protein kinase domain-containing protein n=1 Tax=Urochloa decumbens TaxID=240449 RepID=A0ABC9DW89_9POAL